MITDHQYVVESFEKEFSNCKNKKIVLYGKGPYTNLILEVIKDYNIVGVMDRDIKEGYLFGKPVLSYKEVVEQNVDLIIVVARPNSIRAVFERIRIFCSINCIQLYGINGENLFERFQIDNMADEEVIYKFQKNFSGFKNKKIVLYGKGPRTGILVNAFSDYNIIGLMDKNVKEGIFFGKKILSYEEVRDLKADIVISVTREHSTPHVYNRINRFCSLNHILLYDIEGNNLFQKYGRQKHYVESDPYFDVCEELLRTEIEKHEVISFDIFDTLIMRKTLLPADVFEIVGKKAAEEGIIIENFRRLRMLAERESVVNHANIYDIYSVFQELTGISSKDRMRLIEIEIEIETQVLIPRVKMVELYNYAISLGKQICLISDMYLPGKCIGKMLEKLGIVEYNKLFVSCDYCCSKGSGIYEVVKRQVTGRSYLHIGDNPIADGECAKNSGYDTFIIKKAIDLLDLSSYSQLRQIAGTINERSMLGLFIAKIFNNPFALYHSQGKADVGESYEFGYLFIAPIIAKFMIWFVEKIKTRKYDDVLFSARDGYLILQLYKNMKKYRKLYNLPEGIYFPTSRLLNASISRITEDDIRYSAGQPRSYTPEKMLMRKFKLREKEIIPYEEALYGDAVTYALEHKNIIFKRSEETRKSYYKYLERIGLKENKKYGLFDFVSSGTSQYDMSRVVPFSIEGLYLCFYDIGEENRRKLPVHAMLMDNYPENNCYTSYIKKSYLFENYVFLEAVMTSSETSVEGIDEEGNLIYGQEHRSQEELYFMEETHRAIIDFFREFIGELYVENSGISIEFVDECYRYKDLEYTNEHCKELDGVSVFEDLGYGKLYFERK